MLTYLRVRNLAVLRDVEVALGAGLNVLSGETGAGKSILVDALGLLLGERADADRVRRGTSAAIVEGEFMADSPETLQALKEAGIEWEEAEPLVVRRELSIEAPNRVFVNETLTSLASLRRMMEPLVALHGQNRHLTLAGRDAQRQFLDAGCPCGKGRSVVPENPGFRHSRRGPGYAPLACAGHAYHSANHSQYHRGRHTVCGIRHSD